MSDSKSKFDVQGYGILTECKNTVVFAAYVIQNFLAWAFFGGWYAGPTEKRLRIAACSMSIACHPVETASETQTATGA